MLQRGQFRSTNSIPESIVSQQTHQNQLVLLSLHVVVLYYQGIRSPSHRVNKLFAFLFEYFMTCYNILILHLDFTGLFYFLNFEISE